MPWFGLASWSNQDLSQGGSTFVLQLVNEDFTPHWCLGMSNDDYHADKTAVSSSGLREILKSPFSFYNKHFGKFKSEESSAFRIGTAIHMAILQPDLFHRSYHLQPKFSGAGAVKNKADWLLSLPKDSIVLKEDEFNDLKEMVNSVHRNRIACHILRSGQSEVSGYFRHESGVKCRIRPDFWDDKSGILLDVKSTRSVEASEFSKSIWQFRYDFQMAFYSEGIRQITGKNVDLPLFLVIEKHAPFECAIYQADELMLEKGKMDFNRAMNTLKECLQTNSWKPYQSKIQPISLPKWALMENT